MRLRYLAIQDAANDMLVELKQKGLVDISEEGLPSLAEKITKVLSDYHEIVVEIEDEAEDLMTVYGMEEGYLRKKAIRRLADDKGIEVYGKGLDYLNEKIDGVLLDADEVDEIYGQPNELVATITPHLKQLAVNKKDIER